MVYRPLAALARQTQTDTDLLPPRPAKVKTAVAARGWYRWLTKRNTLVQHTGVLTEGHAVFFAGQSRPAKI